MPVVPEDTVKSTSGAHGKSGHRGRLRGLRYLVCVAGLSAGPVLAHAVHPVRTSAPASFEIITHRMDVDVDGAPNAYGPPGSKTLDVLKHAHAGGDEHAPIVGYLTDDDDPTLPVVQGPGDPFPGLYISQTAFTDPARKNERDVLRYVDASKINYVVLGDEARRRGAKIGDFVAVYSRRTGRSSFGVVGDAGNPSGDEGSLHLLQELGYAFHDGRRESVEHPGEIIIRFFPSSNPRRKFFRTQAALDAEAERLGLSREFEHKNSKRSK